MTHAVERRAVLVAQIGALFAVVVWGASFVATKYALREMSPIGLIFTRFALGSALLIGVLVARGERLVPRRSSWRVLALLGFVGIFFHQLLQAHALTMTSASSTGWLIGLVPIWSAILAVIFLGERFGPVQLVGLALGFVGAALVVARTGADAAGLLALPSTRGDLLVIVSTVSWAVYTILGRSVLRRLGAAQATAAAMVLGWLMLGPFFVAAGAWRDWVSLSPTGWGMVLFLGLFCSGLGYLFWYTALSKVEASRVAAFLYIEPFVTLAAATALLGEPLERTMIVGGILVLVGVFLVQRSPA